MRRFSVAFSFLFILTVSLLSAPFAQAQARMCFPDQPAIAACLVEPFTSYWRTNGGLAVFGYPLTDVVPVPGPAVGSTVQAQWTERNRLESHPTNPAPYKVLIGRMGAERLAQLGRDPAAEGREAGAIAGCLWFEETGHNVCEQTPGQGFKPYWQSNGLQVAGLDAYGRSLMLFGLPLTAARNEIGSDGQSVLTQWFERARFEWHPANPTQYRVLLGLLGSEVQQQTPAANASTRPTLFGAEIARGAVTSVQARIRETRLNWVRYNGVRWSEVESPEGVRYWDELSGVDQDLQAITAQGGQALVVVRGTPAWARTATAAECGAIKPEALDAFANFMGALVARYSVAPFNVRYWELWNEPDVDPALVAPDAVYGCWGDSNDPYYGGGYYAEMLKKVYPAIKRADPNAQVVVGGLLLDCDPENPPAGKDCTPGKFLEGILRNGGGDSFDIVGYHAYTYWNAGRMDWDRIQASWRHRGGVTAGKLDFLRATLGRYNLQKPILQDEAALLCRRSDPACFTGTYLNDQANYVVRLYTRSLTSAVTGVIWYTLNGPGWQDGGLLDSTQAPRPAYKAMRFLNSILRDATYVAPLGSGTTEGYAFRNGDTSYRIYWTNDTTTATLPLPPNTRAIYDPQGQPLSLGANLSIGFEPIIVESNAP